MCLRSGEPGEPSVPGSTKESHRLLLPADEDADVSVRVFAGDRDDGPDVSPGAGERTGRPRHAASARVGNVDVGHDHPGRRSCDSSSVAVNAVSPVSEPTARTANAFPSAARRSTASPVTPAVAVLRGDRHAQGGVRREVVNLRGHDGLRVVFWRAGGRQSPGCRANIRSGRAPGGLTSPGSPELVTRRRVGRTARSWRRGAGRRRCAGCRAGTSVVLQGRVAEAAGEELHHAHPGDDPVREVAEQDVGEVRARAPSSGLPTPATTARPRCRTARAGGRCRRRVDPRNRNGPLPSAALTASPAGSSAPRTSPSASPTRSARPPRPAACSPSAPRRRAGTCRRSRPVVLAVCVRDAASR